MSTEPATADDPLAATLRQLLAPLARLTVARGVTHATLDELLKQALVEAADCSHASLPPHRRVSRISTTTGIHRREVSRLIAALRQGEAQRAPPARSHANELFAHWRTHAAFCDLRGSPAELPRQGPAPSFEALAHCITRDVHPRSLLEELLRLGLAAHDSQRDTVRLVREAFVPQGDEGRMLRVLGRNVGSHLEAAVDNLLHDDHRHFEQAIFAEGLDEAAMAQFRVLVRDQWQALLKTLVPALEAMIARHPAPAAPAGSGPISPTRSHVRLGLYTFAQPQALPPVADAPPETAA